MDNLTESLDRGHSMFTMEHVQHICTLSSLIEAKDYALLVVKNSTANAKNKLNIAKMISCSRSIPTLALSMSNHILAHPSEHLAVSRGI